MMSRTAVEVRDAVPEDAADLVRLWADHVPRSMAPEDDMRLVVKRAAQSGADRILVASYDGVFAGALYLQVAARSPLDPEPVLNLLLPEVLATFRRHGVGHALMEAGVAHAEKLGVSQVRSASDTGDRLAQRFMARLALSPVATFRAAPTHVVRAKLAGGSRGRPGARALTAVVAQRRSQRRRQPVE